MTDVDINPAPPPLRVNRNLATVAAYSWRLLAVGLLTAAALWLVGQLLVVVVPLAVAGAGRGPCRRWQHDCASARPPRGRGGGQRARRLPPRRRRDHWVRQLGGRRRAQRAGDDPPSEGVDDVTDWLVQDGPFDVTRDVERWREQAGEAVSDVRRVRDGRVLSGPSPPGRSSSAASSPSSSRSSSCATADGSSSAASSCCPPPAARSPGRACAASVGRHRRLPARRSPPRSRRVRDHRRHLPPRRRRPRRAGDGRHVPRRRWFPSWARSPPVSSPSSSPSSRPDLSRAHRRRRGDRRAATGQRPPRAGHLRADAASTRSSSCSASPPAVRCSGWWEPSSRSRLAVVLNAAGEVRYSLASRTAGPASDTAPPVAEHWRGTNLQVVFDDLFDLPGVEPTSIDLTVERNVLSVHAERPAPGRR